MQQLWSDCTCNRDGEGQTSVAVAIKVLVEGLDRTAWDFEGHHVGEHETTRRLEEARKMLHWLCLGQHLRAGTKLGHTHLVCKELGSSIPSKIWPVQSDDNIRSLTGTSAALGKLIAMAMRCNKTEIVMSIM